MTRASWIIRLAPILLPVASIVPAATGFSSRLGPNGLSFDNLVYLVFALTFFTVRLPLLLAIGLAFMVLDMKNCNASKEKVFILILLCTLAAFDGYRIGRGVYF